MQDAERKSVKVAFVVEVITVCFVYIGIEI